MGFGTPERLYNAEASQLGLTAATRATDHLPGGPAHSGWALFLLRLGCRQVAFRLRYQLGLAAPERPRNLEDERERRHVLAALHLAMCERSIPARCASASCATPCSVRSPRRADHDLPYALHHFAHGHGATANIIRLSAQDG